MTHFVMKNAILVVSIAPKMSQWYAIRPCGLTTDGLDSLQTCEANNTFLESVLTLDLIIVWSKIGSHKSIRNGPICRKHRTIIQIVCCQIRSLLKYNVTSSFKIPELKQMDEITT